MSDPTSPAPGLVREMRLWDVILFNIAAVLGPRWVASAAHIGPSSLTLWVLATLFFFLPSAWTITELATRYPAEGGLYVWAREAFGPFHGFIAGWTYWIYSIIYFPALLNASVAMATYLGGPRTAALAQHRGYIMAASLLMLALALGFNLVGVRIGKWLENAGGIGTYLPLVMLVCVGVAYVHRFGLATPFSWSALVIRLDWGTLNYWAQIAFAFSGLELVCMMSEEIHEPERVLPRSILISAVLIAAIYLLGTAATLGVLRPENVDVRTGAIQALTAASGFFGLGWIAIVTAVVLTVGNIGGVGTTVAGVARVPFAVGIDRYLPPAFASIHPRWKTPWVAMLVQAGLAAVLLVVSQLGETVAGAYQILVDATTIMYFIPFLYMFGALIGLRHRPDRGRGAHHSLVPGGQVGIWLMGVIGGVVTLGAIILSAIPPSDVVAKGWFEVKVLGGCVVLVTAGLGLYWRRQRAERST
ncbi:MAG: APC family permease [Terriglobales bacterium]